MSMTAFHRLILDKAGPDLLNDLDTEDIVAHLVGDEAITRDDVDKVNSEPTRKKKVQQLLDILPRRGDGAYVSFLSSLAKTDGSQHLYDSMKRLEEAYEDRMDETPGVFQEGIDTISNVGMGDFENLETNTLVNLQPTGGPARGRQPQNPYKVLKDPDLLQLAQGLGEHWETLALQLDLNRATIYHCKENNRYNVQSQIFDMLYKWKCRKGSEATVAVLVDACKQIETLGEDVYEFLYTL